jgi:hypothetical protein
LSGQWKPNLTDRYDAADWYEEAGMTGERQLGPVVVCTRCDGTGIEPFESSAYPPEPCSDCGPQVQTSGPKCKQCGAFTTYKRVNTHGLCMKCELDGGLRAPDRELEEEIERAARILGAL